MNRPPDASNGTGAGPEASSRPAGGPTAAATADADVSVQAVIVELLRRLQRERRLAMIFITHNLALVRSIAQTVVVLSEGTLVEAGPVADILERPTDPYTIRLMEDVPKLTESTQAR